MALSFAGISLSNRINSNKRLLAVLSPYFLPLVQSEDRPEVLRFIESISNTKDGDVVVVRNEIVFASSRSVAEMDQPFEHPKNGLSLLGSYFSKTQIINQTSTTADSGDQLRVEIYLFSPLWPTLIRALLIGIAAFAMCLLVSWYGIRKMKRAIKRALIPLDTLHEEIQKLHQNVALSDSPLPIRELEEIRGAILTTKIALENTKDSLAYEKAKQLSAESYQRLIHDLHTPVAALSAMSRVLSLEDISKEDYHSAALKIPAVAEQILNQVRAAKKNLENQPESLRESDLRDCVRASVERIKQTASSNIQSRLKLVVPENPVMTEHDPALLQRAIINLLENAVEASREKVLISIEQTESQAIIRVSDDGAGMEESKISLYLQGKGQSKKAARQAFGLSSVNHIVRTHGGKVIYRKSDLGGASFEIRLGVAI